MKTGREFSALVSAVINGENFKIDRTVPAANIQMQNDGESFMLNDPRKNTVYAYTHLTDVFHRQLSAATGIPYRYYEAMRQEKPELLAENVNAWMSTKPSEHMIRGITTESGLTARALLSPKYRRFDNPIIIKEVFLPLFMGNPDYHVESCEMTDERLYLKIVNKRLQGEVRPGDYVQGGLIISNSEVGMGSVYVQPLLYRLVCSNGMVVNDFGEKRRHIGRRLSVGEDFTIYSDETMQADDRALALKLRDAAMAAVEEVRFAALIDKMKEASEAKITGNPQHVIELAGRDYGITNSEQQSMLEYLIKGGDPSLYGVANAVTRLAQDAESYDRSTQLEATGYQIMTMPPSKWKEYNKRR